MFEIGIKTGKWMAVIDAFSFTDEDPQRLEERAAGIATASA